MHSLPKTSCLYTLLGVLRVPNRDNSEHVRRGDVILPGSGQPELVRLPGTQRRQELRKHSHTHGQTCSVVCQAVTKTLDVAPARSHPPSTAGRLFLIRNDRFRGMYDETPKRLLLAGFT